MIGNVVGNYKILEKIGEGGMGAVYKGIDLMLERDVAIKVLRPELGRQPAIVERFRAEAVTLAKLNHSNIATLHSFFRQGDDFFMVMEFVRGETLDSIIRKHGAMSVEKAVSLFCQALDGIDHAHKMGIVHRDIKPANMMLTASGSIKVMDFGIARVLGTARMTREGHLIGTIEYMSPEQIRGQETDARSDIYSLGILLYEMLTGRVPFNAQSEYQLMRSQIEAAPQPPRDFAPHISLPIEETIMRSLAKRPEARFQSAGHFRNALLNCMRAATNPLDATVIPRFSAPVTKVNDPTTAPELKDAQAPVAADAYALAGKQITPTRLVPAEAPPPAQPVYQQTPVAAAPVQQYARVPAAHPSFLSRLTWKHYGAAAATVLVVLVGGLVVILGMINKNSGQPAQQTQPATTQFQPAPAQTPSSQDPALAGPFTTGTINGRGNDASKAKSRSGLDKPEETAGTDTATSPPKTDQQAKGETKETSTKSASNAKEDDKKDDKKINKIGGAIKKIGGWFKGGDKDDKKKKP